MLFPLEVGVGDKDIEKLTKFYKRAYTKIIQEIEGATDFGIYNRRMILAQIEDILKTLGEDVQRFIDYEIPHNYKVGADQAIRQLNSFGYGLVVDMGFNKLHNQTIELLIGDTMQSFGDSINGVKRSATQLLNQAVKEQIKIRIAEGISMGKTLKEVKNYIVGYLRDNDLTSLIDKGGHKWTLDRYTEMLIRTKTAEARNMGLINRTAELDHDLVQVSDHDATCDLCGPWEGQILSITGRTIGYPTLTEAESQGLFHPNCRHAINVYDDKYVGRLRKYNPENGKYELDTTT